MNWRKKKTIIPQCDCSVHDVITKIIEYLIITPIFAVGYLTVSIPWMLFVIELNPEQFNKWVIESILIDLVVAYPIAKLVMRIRPYIESISRLGH